MAQLEKAARLCVSTKTTVEEIRSLDFPEEQVKNVNGGLTLLRLLRDTRCVDRLIAAHVQRTRWQAAPNAVEKHDPLVQAFVHNMATVDDMLLCCVPLLMTAVSAAFGSAEASSVVMEEAACQNGDAMRNLCRLLKASLLRTCSVLRNPCPDPCVPCR